MSEPITLDTIRTAADHLGNMAAASAAVAAKLDEELKATFAPIYARYRPMLDATAEDQAAAHRALADLLDSAPHLFAKTPRSLIVNGVKVGYRKAEDSLDWDADDVVIKRIRALAAEHADVCIRTTEAIVVDALAQLPQAKLSTLGVRRIPGVDNPFITIGLSEVDALVKTIIASAQQRRGEDDKPKAKKGKAKAKAEAA